MPTIVLGQEEVDCFAAWVSIEAGLPECVDPTTEIKVSTLPSLFNAVPNWKALLDRLTMESYCWRPY